MRYRRIVGYWCIQLERGRFLRNQRAVGIQEVSQGDLSSTDMLCWNQPVLFNT